MSLSKWLETLSVIEGLKTLKPSQTPDKSSQFTSEVYEMEYKVYNFRS